MNFLKPYFWRLIFSVVGFVIAIMFLSLGFATTFFIILCCIIGYAVGINADKKIQFTKKLKYWLNNR